MNPLHELRRALITAWLLDFPQVQATYGELQRLILMWIRTPHSTTMMWVESDWMDPDSEREATRAETV